MPSWWGKSSSKDVKKKTTKENFIDTLHRFLSSSEHNGNVRSPGARRHGIDATSERGSLSRAESRSTPPSNQVSCCESFADRPHGQSLPLPGLQTGMIHTSSGISVSKPILERRGKPQLLLPLPTPDRVPRRPDTTDIDGDMATTSVSRLHSPVGKEFDISTRAAANHNFSILHNDQSPRTAQKNSRETAKPVNLLFSNPILSTSPKLGVLSNQTNKQIPQHGAFASAPDSSMSSPSRSPIRVVFPEQIPSAVFWAAKPYPDATFLGSGQCSSPGSGQTSGHNSMAGDMLGQSFWQHSRGSPECSPVPSPRMTSPGPSSRIHSGAVSPLHPRAGGTAPESPSSWHDEGKKRSDRLPLPPLNLSNISPFSPNIIQSTTSAIPSSPGRIDNPQSPGSPWKKGKMIGHGTFGHVYVGFNGHLNRPITEMKRVENSPPPPAELVIPSTGGYGSTSRRKSEDTRVKPSFKLFSQEEIQDAINNFKSLMIGHGGYGKVYKCQLDNWDVAVKILDDQGDQGLKEYIREMEVLETMRHENLIHLMGTCFKLRALIYEYLPNGSLEDCLKDRPGELTWGIRTRIVYEICTALRFLHANKPEPLVHGDLKPHNVLLDANFKVKLADFGLCRYLTQGENSKVFRLTTHVSGSPGYMDPDFLETRKITPGVDVYSLGKTVVRILTGKHPPDVFREVYEAKRAGSFMSIVDPAVRGWPVYVVEILTRFALKAIKPDRNRPEFLAKFHSELEKILGGIDN